jgi:integrase
MARKPAGQVIELTRQRGRTFALRFRAYGRRHYLTLGSVEEGWTRGRAEQELANVMADIRRGIWRPPEPERELAGPRPEPTFHRFASEWFEAHRGELRPTTQADYRWRLENHLLPFFARHLLSEITIEEVDRYRHTKVREDALSAESINKTLGLLAQILEVAIEYGHLERNPASGRRRRLRVTRPQPIYLDTAEQITALLEAASDLDARPAARTAGRRPLLAVMVFGGLRVSEACRLRWRDVDLSSGRLTIRDSKTAAGARRVDMLPVLRDELAAHKAVSRAEPGALVFRTASGRPRTRDNVRERVLAPVVRRADELLANREQPPLPEGLSAHKLRHTFASILAACGEDPAYVMAQLGHTDPRFTLRVYTHLMSRREGERERLEALVMGTDWAALGTTRAEDPSKGPAETSSARPESAPDAGDGEHGRGWFRTSDLSRVKRALSH